MACYHELKKRVIDRNNQAPRLIFTVPRLYTNGLQQGGCTEFNEPPLNRPLRQCTLAFRLSVRSARDPPMLTRRQYAS